jgi:hypothetical protein
MLITPKIKNSHKRYLFKTVAFFCIFALQPTPSHSEGMKTISLKTYSQTGILIDNPATVSELPRGETYQVNHKNFSLQFFFNQKDIFGIILKRDKSRPIHFKWCFFKNCEESQHDYKKVIADPFNAPFEKEFFSIPNPSYLPYSFLGIEFFSPK